MAQGTSKGYIEDGHKTRKNLGEGDQEIKGLGAMAYKKQVGSKNDPQISR